MNVELDFLCDTIVHVSEVAENLEICASNLRQRGHAHDRTKFQPMEFDAFVSTREKLKRAKFGAPEQQECVDTIRQAVDHHHANNQHHVQYYSDGIKDMSLLDILEMICDWRAATRRNSESRFKGFLEVAIKKYNISPELEKIIQTTLKELGWDGE